MKKCPNCNRQYSDESLNFCLDDGTVLITDSDNSTDENIKRPTEQQTEMLSYDQGTEAIEIDKQTENYSNENETVLRTQTVANESQPQIIKQGVSPMFAYLSVGLLALLVLLAGVGIAVWYNLNRTTDSNTELSQKNSNSLQSNLKKNEVAGKEDKGTIDLANNKKTTPKKTPKKDTKETPKKDKDKDTNVKPSPEATKTRTPAPTVKPKPTETPKPDKGKYFVILGSFPKSQAAKAKKRLQFARSKGLPVRIVNTNNVAGLRNGLLAVVMGPYSKPAAQGALRRAKSVSPDSYIKAG